MSSTGVVVWITGKPSAGKSRFSKILAERLKLEGTPSVILDGDVVRAALSPAPGYDPASREHFYATLANLAALVARQGLVVLVPATAHRRSFRDHARAAAPAFLEVFIDASQADVEARDAKGLYRASHEGRARDVPGADLQYEPPLEPDVRAHGGRDEEAARVALSRLRELLR